MRFVVVAVGFAVALGACAPRSLGPDARTPAVCGARDVMLELLEQRFGETGSGHGREDETGQLVELVTSPTGSWTVLATTPLGATCVRLAGTGWEGLTDGWRRE